jgi:glucose/arabinose dehydrogenase
MSRSLCVLVALASFALLSVPATAQPTAGQQVESVLTPDGPISVENVVGGLNHPWAMAFLPDGRILVTERNGGALRIVQLDGTLSAPVEGTPQTYAQGQGGMLDVALDPDFAENGYVYLSYAAPGPEGSAATALGRGRWVDDRIEGFEEIFLQEPWITGPNHFGNRIAFGPEGHLFLTLGERFQFEPAQDLSNHLGKVVRLNRDGSIPADNPFVGDPDAEDAIWSYGHRNIQAAAIHPETGDLWVAEMGPLGGDELNQPEAGKNYGWPVVSWGIHYGGDDIPDPPTRPEFADAVKHWSPVISPSGMVVYTGDAFPAYRGHVFIGSLSGHQLVRVVLDGETVVDEERIPLGTRIRDVEQGPDGFLYLLTDEDDGNVWRMKPMD